MKVLAFEKEKPGVRPEDFAPHRAAEARAVWALYESGVVREAFFRSDRKEAVLVLECMDTSEAMETLANLPLVQARLIEFEVIGLRPYDGFARLMTPQAS